MDEALSAAPISANPTNPVWRGLKDVAFGSVSDLILSFVRCTRSYETLPCFLENSLFETVADFVVDSRNNIKSI